MRVVFLSCVSVTIELENKEVYYSLKAFDVYLNDKKVLSNYKKNVFSLFDLTPDTEYVVSVDNETISFRSESVSEVIDVYPIEGDATTMYINKKLTGKNVTVSRLSYGIPMGAEIDYLDVMTLNRAIEDRKKIS